MCEGPGIDNDGVGGRRSGPGFLNSVDQASLMVALEIFKLNVWESLADASEELREGFRAIKGRVASTKHIEVRTVEDKKFHIAGESDNSGNEKEQQETEVYAAALPLSSAVRTGLEPATPCVTGMYSNQLN